MENNKIKPTSIDALRIYCQYLGQKVVHDQGGMARTLIGMGGFDDGDFQYIKARLGDYKGHIVNAFVSPDHGSWRILLKPIENISQQDALEWGHARRCFSGKKREFISFEIQGSYYRWFTALGGSTMVSFQGFDAFDYTFLREKGYALPYKNWSVEELVEFGIYKLTY